MFGKKMKCSGEVPISVEVAEQVGAAKQELFGVLKQFVREYVREELGGRSKIEFFPWKVEIGAALDEIVGACPFPDDGARRLVSTANHNLVCSETPMEFWRRSSFLDLALVHTSPFCPPISDRMMKLRRTKCDASRWLASSAWSSYIAPTWNAIKPYNPCLGWLARLIFRVAAYQDALADNIPVGAKTVSDLLGQVTTGDDWQWAITRVPRSRWTPEMLEALGKSDFVPFAAKVWGEGDTWGKEARMQEKLGGETMYYPAMENLQRSSYIRTLIREVRQRGGTYIADQAERLLGESATLEQFWSRVLTFYLAISAGASPYYIEWAAPNEYARTRLQEATGEAALSDIWHLVQAVWREAHKVESDEHAIQYVIDAVVTAATMEDRPKNMSLVQFAWVVLLQRTGDWVVPELVQKIPVWEMSPVLHGALRHTFEVEYKREMEQLYGSAMKKGLKG